MERLKMAVTDGAIASAVILASYQRHHLDQWTWWCLSISTAQYFFNSTKQVLRASVHLVQVYRGMMGGTLQLKHSEKNE